MCLAMSSNWQVLPSTSSTQRWREVVTKRKGVLLLRLLQVPDLV
jgi:hypothetical protein